MANLSYMIGGIIIITYIQCGTPLKCYECKSEFNGNCDNIKGKTIPDEVCEHSKLIKAFPQAGSKFVCVKHRMSQKDEPHLSVVRGCVPDNYCSYFTKSTDCLTCETDLCNSSTSILPFIGFTVLSIIVCAKYYM